VELAFVLPVVVMLCMAVFQVALVARDVVLTVHAARAAAREAAVDAGTRRVEGAAHDVLAGARVEVSRAREIGDPVTVTVRYRSKTDLPLVGPLFPNPELHAKSVMRKER
jgi:hypothetical protein